MTAACRPNDDEYMACLRKNCFQLFVGLVFRHDVGCGRMCPLNDCIICQESISKVINLRVKPCSL